MWATKRRACPSIGNEVRIEEVTRGIKMPTSLIPRKAVIRTRIKPAKSKNLRQQEHRHQKVLKEPTLKKLGKQVKASTKSLTHIKHAPC